MVGTRKSGNAFIEHPDQVRVDDNKGVMTFCWLHEGRVCTGGCQAFDPNYADDDTGRFTACRLINIPIATASAFAKLVQGMTPAREIPGQTIKPPEVT